MTSVTCKGWTWTARLLGGKVHVHAVRQAAVDDGSLSVISTSFSAAWLRRVVTRLTTQDRVWQLPDAQIKLSIGGGEIFRVPLSLLQQCLGIEPARQTALPPNSMAALWDASYEIATPDDYERIRRALASVLRCGNASPMPFMGRTLHCANARPCDGTPHRATIEDLVCTWDGGGSNFTVAPAMLCGEASPMPFVGRTLHCENSGTCNGTPHRATFEDLACTWDGEGNFTARRRDDSHD